MGSQEDVFVEKLCKALVACAEARQAVPLDWDEDVQKQCRRAIAAGMGLIQSPCMTIGVGWDRENLSWVAHVFDVSGSRTVNCERRIRDLAVNITGYAMLGGSVARSLRRMLDTHDARQYQKTIPDDARKELASAEQCFRSIADGLGDEGIYPWL